MAGRRAGLRPRRSTGLRAGDAILLITWLDRADRGVLATHPRNDPSLPLTGVFATRSPHRPNPLGLHRVTIRAIEGTRLRVGPLEAIDGTPVVDMKIVWATDDSRAYALDAGRDRHPLPSASASSATASAARPSMRR